MATSNILFLEKSLESTKALARLSPLSSYSLEQKTSTPGKSAKILLLQEDL